MNFTRCTAFAILCFLIFLIFPKETFSEEGCSSKWKLKPKSIDDCPYPSDIFSVADEGNRTGIRLNLPIPESAKGTDEEREIKIMNKLDGFIPRPRVVVPFEGDRLDPKTIKSENIFFLKLDKPDKEKIIGIDQRIYDPKSNKIIFTSAEVLLQSSMYGLIVTGLKTKDNKKVKPSSELSSFFQKYKKGGSSVFSGSYEKKLCKFLDIFKSKSFVDLSDIISISVFTTQSVTALLENLRLELDSGRIKLEKPKMNIDGNPGLEVFPVSKLKRIAQYIHKATITYNGEEKVSFPPNCIRGALLGSPAEEDIYVRNLRNGKMMKVSSKYFTELDRMKWKGGRTLKGLDVSELKAKKGDKLALFAKFIEYSRKEKKKKWDRFRQKKYDPVPHVISNVGKIVFGTFRTPWFLNDKFKMPIVKTKKGCIPDQNGWRTVTFILFLPNETLSLKKPESGWPVCYWAHGGTARGIKNVTTIMANLLAAKGIATIAFNDAGHGGGPEGVLVIQTEDRKTVFPCGGRSVDLNNDGVFGDDEGMKLNQRIVDYMALVRIVRSGVDFDGDDKIDLAQDAKYTSFTGPSRGGRTTIAIMAIDPYIMNGVSNVPGSRWSPGYLPMAGSIRPLYNELLHNHKPKLTNSPSPKYGSGYDEDIPLRNLPIQIGLKEGAEKIQIFLERNHAYRITQDIYFIYCAQHIIARPLPGVPKKKFLLQLAQGESAACQHITADAIAAGKLQKNSCVIYLDNEPAFDGTFKHATDPHGVRHLIIGIPYSGYATTRIKKNIPGYIAHLGRMQIVEFLSSRGKKIVDPDGAGKIFAGDVFITPVSDKLLKELMSTPGFSKKAPGARDWANIQKLKSKFNEIKKARKDRDFRKMKKLLDEILKIWSKISEDTKKEIGKKYPKLLEGMKKIERFRKRFKKDN